MRRIVGNQSHGAALDADKGGDDADSPLGTKLQHGTHIGNPLNHLAHVVIPQTVLRHHKSQFSRIGGFPRINRTLKIREILLCANHRFGFVCHFDVHDAIGYLHIHRPHFIWRENTQAAPFNHGRSTDANIGTLCRNDHITAAEQHGVASEAASGSNTHRWHQTGQFGEIGEGQAIQARNAGTVGVSRTPAAAFGEQDHRQLELLGNLEQTIFFIVIFHALGAGQHHVVIGHDHGPTLVFGEQIAVDLAKPSHHAVPRRILDEVFHGSSAALTGHDYGAVLDEGTLVTQVRDVFSRRSTAGLVALGHGFRAVFIQTRAFAIKDFLQIWTYVIQIKLFQLVFVSSRHVLLAQHDQWVTFKHGVTRANA